MLIVLYAAAAKTAEQMQRHHMPLYALLLHNAPSLTPFSDPVWCWLDVHTTDLSHGWSWVEGRWPLVLPADYATFILLKTWFYARYRCVWGICTKMSSHCSTDVKFFIECQVVIGTMCNNGLLFIIMWKLRTLFTGLFIVVQLHQKWTVLKTMKLV